MLIYIFPSGAVVLHILTFSILIQSTGNSKVLARAFNVIYTPEKSGIYEIYVFCGNVLLNGGHSFRKEVRAGIVSNLTFDLDRFPKFSLPFIKKTCCLWFNHFLVSYKIKV
jgi:hypothetical protein